MDYEPTCLSQLPDVMQEAVELYIENGIRPGSFLTAVLSNDLKEAFCCADHWNTRLMSTWVQWLMWECPNMAQGSPELVEEWIKHGGLKGFNGE